MGGWVDGGGGGMWGDPRGHGVGPLAGRTPAPPRLSIRPPRTATHPPLHPQAQPLAPPSLQLVAKEYGGGWEPDPLMHVWRRHAQRGPVARRGKWAAEEDEALLRAMAVHGRKWSKVAQLVPGRTDVQCRERFMNVHNPDLRTGEAWREEEDQMLAALVPQLRRTNSRVRRREGEGGGGRVLRWPAGVAPHAAPLAASQPASRPAGRPASNSQQPVPASSVQEPCAALCSCSLCAAALSTCMLRAWDELQVKWSAVARHIPGRTDKQCALRWQHLASK